MKKIAALFLLGIFLTPAWAADPSQLHAQAGKDMATAREIMSQAKEMVVQSPTTENMRAAISLYARAGEMLERAANAYQQLLPDHATQQEVDNAQNGIRFCIASIRDIQQHFPIHHD